MALPESGSRWSKAFSTVPFIALSSLALAGIILPWSPGQDYSARVAFRIHDPVVRGEIDNRVKGHVRGRLWLHGLAQPVTLELEGNACPDLAGCLLQFKNPTKTFPLRKKPQFDPVQRGRIGNLSASRKVRVSKPSGRAKSALKKRGKQPPERMANALCLEWFSDANGRVVIESTDYELTISPPESRLSPPEEMQRAQDAEAGWAGFLGKLDEALEKRQRNQKAPEADWDEHDYDSSRRATRTRTSTWNSMKNTATPTRPRRRSPRRWAGCAS